MIKPIFTVLILWASSVALVACGSAPPRKPYALEQAGKTDQTAYRAMREGDLFRARELFGQSALMYQALEDTPAFAQSTINLATLNHRLGNDDEALQSLVLLVNNPQVSNDLKATAAFRQAIILADQGKYEELQQPLNTAAVLCHSDCGFIAGLHNLQARLALHKSDPVTAFALANTVIRSNANQDELANAYRIAATIELGQQHPEQAQEYFQAALTLDKALALSSRIADDLDGISHALLQKGNPAEAAVYARRAKDVRSAFQKLKDSNLQKLAP